MTLSIQRLCTLGAMLLMTMLLGGCGYNEFQRLDEDVNAAWAEVLNQYQRRADLVPNLVATVKGEANFEQETLTRVIEARAKATSVQATPALVNDPAAFQKFQAAQGELGSALSRLLVVTENRITVARNRYIKAVQAYNVQARSFPSNLTAMVFGYKAKPSFTVQDEGAVSKPPAVSFEPAASR